MEQSHVRDRLRALEVIAEQYNRRIKELECRMATIENEAVRKTKPVID